MPVRVEPFFVIVAILLGLQLKPVWLVVAWVGIVFVSVLVHEMGHALMFRVAGQRSAVVLHGFGGFTVPTGGGRRNMSKGMSIAVSLSGVAAQLLLLALPVWLLLQTRWGATQEASWLGAAVYNGDLILSNTADGAEKWAFNIWPVLRMILWANVAWAVLNILPIRPLDGGHVAEELFGFRNACILSIGAAVLAGIYLYSEWNSLFVLIFMGMYAFFNYRDLKEGHNTGTFDVEAPEAPPSRAGGARSGGALTGKRRRSSHLQAVPTPGELAAELMGPRSAGEVEARVWNALRGGDADRAASILKQAGPNAPRGFVQASVALAQGHTGLAGDMFEAAYLAEPAGPPNLVPATLLAEHGAAVPLAKGLVQAGPTGIEAAGSLQTHLHYAERYREAAEVGEQVFAAGPSSQAQVAFEVACSWAKANRADEALRWVEAAVDAGFRAPNILDSEPDLAPVRALPGWPAVRARLSA